MKTLHWLILSITLFVSAGLAAPAAARPAHLQCTGEVSNLTIRGDLLVPEGEHCQLDTVTVQGDARVHGRSTLEVFNSRIEGALSGSRFELVSLNGSSIGKHLRLADGVSIRLELVTVGANTRLDAYDTRITQAQVSGDLVVRGGRELVQLCDSTVGGDARFADHTGALQLGGDPATCVANEVQGSLRVHHNRADITIANNTIGRNLVCAANEPAPVFYANQIGGTARGQCGAGEAVDARELDDTE